MTYRPRVHIEDDEPLRVPARLATSVPITLIGLCLAAAIIAAWVEIVRSLFGG